MCKPDCSGCSRTRPAAHYLSDYERCQDARRAQAAEDARTARRQAATPLLRFHLPTARYAPAQAVAVAEIWVNPSILRTIGADLTAGCVEPVKVQATHMTEGPPYAPVDPVDHRFVDTLIRQGRTTISVRVRTS